MARWMSNTRYSSEVYNLLCQSYCLDLSFSNDTVLMDIPFAIGEQVLYFMAPSNQIFPDSFPGSSPYRIRIKSQNTDSLAYVEYDMRVEYLAMSHAEWLEGFSYVTVRHGDCVQSFGKKKFDALYKLVPVSGRYYGADRMVYSIRGGKLSEMIVDNDAQDFSEYLIVN